MCFEHDENKALNLWRVGRRRTTRRKKEKKEWEAGEQREEAGKTERWSSEDGIIRVSCSTWFPSLQVPIPLDKLSPSASGCWPGMVHALPSRALFILRSAFRWLEATWPSAPPGAPSCLDQPPRQKRHTWAFDFVSALSSLLMEKMRLNDSALERGWTVLNSY